MRPQNRRKRGKRKRLSKAVERAWQAAINVTPQQVAAYEPSEAECLVASALAAGQVSIDEIVAHTALNRPQVQSILNQPIAMAWVSEQLERLLKLRRGMVDASLFARAIAGDVAAARLYYDRHEIMQQRAAAVNVNIGTINYDAMSDDDLRTILAGKLSSPAAAALVTDVPHEVTDES